MWGRARPRAASANVVQLALILAALHLPVSGHAAPPADEQAVVLDGLPQVIEAHRELQAGEEYLATVMLRLPATDKRIAIPVFRGAKADDIAAAFFRKHLLPFDRHYIPVHNAVHAVLLGDGGGERASQGMWGEDITQSRAPERAPPHPFRVQLEAQSKVLVYVQVAGPGIASEHSGQAIPAVEVLEGEEAGAAVAR